MAVAQGRISKLFFNKSFAEFARKPPREGCPRTLKAHLASCALYVLVVQRLRRAQQAQAGDGAPAQETDSLAMCVKALQPPWLGSLTDSGAVVAKAVQDALVPPQDA